MINFNHSCLSLARQCCLLGVNRTTLYYRPVAELEVNVEIMNQIRDSWHTHPFYGYRRITEAMRRIGYPINRKRIKRLMDVMGLEAIYPKPKTSESDEKAEKYPYLLNRSAITAPNQAWCVDITYLKLCKGFMYLSALIDVHSRYVVGWCLSNTLDTEYCLGALEIGLEVAIPDMVNSDQGCQFTSHLWIKALKNRGIQVSMDGKGRCLDNIPIERFWRSFKYEEFYLNSYDSVRELRQAVATYIKFYNHERGHQSLGYQTPGEIYQGGKGELVVVAEGIRHVHQNQSVQFNKKHEKEVKVGLKQH